MRKYINKFGLLLCLLIVGTTSMAQEVKVESFFLDPTDLSAVANETLDANGKPCALLKIMIVDKNVGFESNCIVKTENKGHNEYWVWLNAGTPNITIQPVNYKPIEVIFINYNVTIARLQSKCTYILNVSIPQKKDGMVNVTFTSDIPLSELKIDGFLTDDDRSTFPIQYGKHKIFASAPGYEEFEEDIELDIASSDMDFFIPMIKTPTDADSQVLLAKEYYDLGKYNQAFRLFRQSANNDNGRGQYFLGMMYSNGDGVNKDEGTAKVWYQKAVEKNDSDAMIGLGDILVNEGHRVDAANLYKQAASLGNAEGYYKLVIKLDYSLEKQAEFLFKGAEMNHAGCQHSLGLSYYSGGRVKKDYAEAIKWFTIAAEQNFVPSMFALGLMYEKGIGTKKDSKMAADLFRKAVILGRDSKRAQVHNSARESAFHLAAMYEEGRGVEKDIAAAAEWYRISNNLGHAHGRKNYERLILKCKNDFLEQ